jgi:PAS domain S-box-containing protein
MPRERALAELFHHAGTQFDPELVRRFAKLSTLTESDISLQISERWTQTLPEAANCFWGLQQPLLGPIDGTSQAPLFQQRLLDAMYDGVIFIDARRRIVLWNRGAERLSGISRESVLEKSWSSAILDLRDGEGNLIRNEHCPIEQVVTTGVQTLRRLTLTRAGASRLTVDTHVIPVMDKHHRCYGSAVLLHDVSSEMNLEKRVQNLHEKATTDPLTGVANRAEFDRFQ